MDKARLIILFTAMLVSATCGQLARPMDPGIPLFEQNMAFYPSKAPGMARLGVYLRIPYSKLQFIKTSEGYLARFDVLLALYKEENLIDKTDRTDSVEVERYFDTQTTDFVRPEEYYLDSIPPGEYQLRISLTDRETKNSYKRIYDVTIPTFKTPEKVQFSSIIPLSNGKYVNSKAYPSSDTFEYRFEIFVPETITGMVLHGLADSEGIFVEETTLVREPGILGISGGLPIKKGLLKFTFYAEFWSRGEIIADREKEIIIASGRHYRTASDMEEVIEQLELIGKRSEIREMEDALEENPEALDSLIDSFWAERDPTPGTKINEIREEFLNRIEEANRRFGGVTPGWRKDRGRVLIIYGEPDEIERHPFDQGRRPYQIWYYYNPRRTFYFEDQLGDGTYELVYQE